MDTGNLKNNFAFYEGFEGEPEIVLTIAEDEDYNIHMWDGYFNDIFGNPVLDGNGWKGFTRDVNQMEGIFSDDDERATIDVPEYLEDSISYTGKSFRYDETSAALELLIAFFENAVKNNLTVMAELL